MTASADLLGALQRHRLRVFTTSDLSTLTGLSAEAASQALRRLASKGLASRLKRGLWASRLAADINPYEAVPHLRAPWPAYVSLYSALADHGVVEEIPQVVYGVSAAPPKRYRTPIGEFRIHHLPARLIWGYELRGLGAASYPIAGPEKAFLDLVYLALSPRSPLEAPVKRGRRWALDPVRLKSCARRFRCEPLERWLRERRLL